jgi:hypothetical protein
LTIQNRGKTSKPLAVTVAAVIENVYLSRRQKAELVTYSFCIQTPACFALFVAQKPDQTLVSQSVQNLPGTGT